MMVASCGPPRSPDTSAEVRTPGQTTFELSGDTTPELPADFTPPPQLADPLPPDPRVFGVGYLEKLGEAISPRWSAFLEDLRVRLPPHAPLNQKRLACVVSFVVTADGALASVKIATPSGQPSFDAVALEALADAAPLVPPPAEVLGDDGVARVRWLFARDARQAGVATARLAPVRYRAAQAVPILVARNDYQEAAARLAAADKMDKTRRAALLDEVARALIAAAAERGHIGAIEMLAEPAAIEASLVDIAKTKGAPARAAAFAALGRARSEALRGLARDAVADMETPDEIVREAAAAWSTLDGAETAIGAGAGEMIDSGDPLKRRRAFIVASVVALPAIGRAAESLLDTDGLELVAPAIARLAAAGDRRSLAVVRKALSSPVANRRVVFATSLAAAPEPLPRRLRSDLRKRLADADERVRAAALVAIAKSWPSSVGRSISRFRRESSPLVLTALAESLALDRSKTATKKLQALLGHPSPTVRAAACRSLWGRTNASQNLAPLASDTDERVARAALPGLPRVKLAELATSGNQLAADALAAALSVDVSVGLAADSIAKAEHDVVAVGLAWLGARKRAKLGG